MIYLPHSLGLIIATCTKCASTSLRNEYQTGNLKPLTNVGVIELKKAGWQVVGLIRDPIDRFESAYNFFQYGQQRKFPNGKTYESIDHFTASVLNGDTDEHWLPQAGQLLLCNRYVDLETFPLAHRVNVVSHKETAVSRARELKDYYSADTELRGRSWQGQ